MVEREKLIDEYKEILKLQIECEALMGDLECARKRIENRLNAVSITVITIPEIK